MDSMPMPRTSCDLSGGRGTSRRAGFALARAAATQHSPRCSASTPGPTLAFVALAPTWSGSGERRGRESNRASS
eukprot:1410115-Pyramimonas_sp.AAC.1